MKLKLLIQKIVIILLIIIIDVFIILLYTISKFNNKDIIEELRFVQDEDLEKPKDLEIQKIVNYEDQYLEAKSKTKQLLVFPKENKSTSMVGYFYLNEVLIADWGMDYTSQCFIECEFDKEIFYDEINRLNSFIHNDKNLLKSNDLFIYPSFISSYNEDGTFEYVIYDENEYKIIYINIFNLPKEYIFFDEKYIPNKLIKDSDLSTAYKKNSFSIYRI